MLTMHRISLSLAALSLLLVGQAAQAEYRPFCASIVGACTHTGPDAPLLRADVCWNGTAAILKGAGSCPTGTKPYRVDYGSVDPLTAIVSGFVPHDDACSVTGVCLSFAPHDGGQESPICCEGGTCWPGTVCPGGSGTILYCNDGVSNDDGTVTCFESESI